MKLRVLALRRLEGADQELPAAVDLVGDLQLSHRVVARHRHDDDAFRRRQRHEADLGAPPIVAAVEDLLLGGRADQLVGAGADRPALGEVVVGEGLDVLALPDVGGQDRIVVLVAECEVVTYPARRRLGEVDHRGQRIGGVDALDPLLVVRRAVQLGRRIADRFERELDVVGGEGLPVRPLDALAEMDRGGEEIGAELEALRLPGNELA